MNPTKQRIAIAESVGWKIEMNDWIAPNSTSLRIKRASSDGDVYIYPPDYLNDLNAMHEVEKTLNSNQWDIYYKQLWDNANYTSRGVIAALHASASQRAEAYLRTIGKWKDNE